MDFDTPAEHRVIRDTIREFYEEEVTPIAQDIEGEHRFSAEIFGQLAELGVMDVPIDEAYDGLGGDQLVCALVVEEPGRVLGGTGLSYAAHVNLTSKPIELFGTDEQKERWLTPLAIGEHLGGWALTGPGSGSDASDMDTVAERGDDGYAVDGTKQLITNANATGSVLVKAITDPGAGHDGISTFIINLKDNDSSEVTTEWDKMRLNSSLTYELSFDDCWVPEDHLLDKEGGGWRQATGTLDGGCISITALSVGFVEDAYGHAKSYAQEREQSDRPISKFDATRSKLISMRRKTERARLLTHKAATRYDAGEWVSRESALAKLDASEAARKVTEDTMQVSGGYDCTTDFAPQRFYHDTKLMEIGEGVGEVQHLIIGRGLGL